MNSIKLSPTESRLFEKFEELPVIDAHEHLAPERVRVSQPMDVCDLFIHYTRTDFLCAGMTNDEWKRMHDKSVDLKSRWAILRKYLPHIRYGSYARPAFIYARHLGFDDINDDNYLDISERLQADNKPGIYRKILVEMCNIRAALTQANRTDYDLDFMIPVMPLDTYAGVRSWKDVQSLCDKLNEKEPNTVDEYVEIAKLGFERWIKEGVVGLKTVSLPFCEYSREKAVSLFDKIKRQEKETLPEMNHLKVYLLETLMDVAADLGLVIAVHTGVWGDFRQLDPRHMISIFARHPKTRFDMYHMGMPWVRDAGLIGKNFPNVWLNLCWSHIVSPEMVCSALDEWIDLVPVNKIIGFGGDYGKPVEKVYGHLTMARENIARVLARRIERGLIDMDDALQIARQWFYETPKELYNLDV